MQQRFLAIEDSGIGVRLVEELLVPEKPCQPSR
jgi:hypothetical protein